MMGEGEGGSLLRQNCSRWEMSKFSAGVETPPESPQCRKSQWVGGSNTLMLTHEISIFVKVLFDFKKKMSSSHFKNVISPKPASSSQWSLISSRNLK